MNRREFLRTGLLLGTAGLLPTTGITSDSLAPAVKTQKPAVLLGRSQSVDTIQNVRKVTLMFEAHSREDGWSYFHGAINPPLTYSCQLCPVLSFFAAQITHLKTPRRPKVQSSKSNQSPISQTSFSFFTYPPFFVCIRKKQIIIFGVAVLAQRILPKLNSHMAFIFAPVAP